MKMEKVGYFLMVGVLCFSMINPAWGVSLSFSNAGPVNQGQLFTTDLMVSGLENTNLAAFDLNVHFDPAVLSFHSYTLGSGLGDTALLEAEDWSLGDLGNGTLNLAELSWLMDFSFQPDAFILASLTFSADQVGLSVLALSDVILSDVYGDAISSGFDPTTIEVLGETANPVPESATILWLGLGFVGLLGWRKISRP